jgi:hypothetical protein
MGRKMFGPKIDEVTADGENYKMRKFMISPLLETQSNLRRLELAASMV